MLQGKRIGPLVGLYVNLVAANIYSQKGPPQAQEKARKAAADDARALTAFPESGWAATIRYRYLASIGEEDRACEEMRRAMGLVESRWPATYYALGLYRRGKLKEALEELRRLEKTGSGAFQDTMQIYILTEMPGGESLAVRKYTEALTRYEGTAVLFLHAMWHLLGREQEALAAYQKLRDHPESLPLLRRESFQRLLNYLCRKISADQLLESVRNSKYDQCNAHYFIAMSLLAAGDRAGARTHFAQCVATGCFDFDASDWSRTFLARMSEDPSWPRSICPQK